MTISITQSIPNFNKTALVQYAANPSRTERIQANEREIEVLEGELSAVKDNIKITKELITTHQESATITKELLARGEKRLSSLTESRNLEIEARNALVKVVEAHDRVITASDKLIDSNNKVITASDKLIDSNNRLIEGSKEGITLKKQAIAIMEKMIPIMEKNPAKYSSLSTAELQKQPEVIEAKAQVVELANSKVEQYPKAERAMLADTAKNVVEATFNEIKPTDIKASIALFGKLETRIEAALDKKHESIAVKDIKHILTDHYKSVEKFSRIRKLDYLDLSLKDLKL